MNQGGTWSVRRRAPHPSGRSKCRPARSASPPGGSSLGTEQTCFKIGFVNVPPRPFGRRSWVPRTRCLGLLGDVSWVRKRTASPPGGRLGGARERSASIPRGRSWVCEQSASPPGGRVKQICCSAPRKVGVATLRGGSSFGPQGRPRPPHSNPLLTPVHL